ncbi:MAG: type II toxin-antitoxin system RelE/ParE family toxin [Prosthecobacter sp.]|nr:type II toxin-antitoxin system RelE/ParE family toxin [Prosthecobacter sp.]
MSFRLSRLAQEDIALIHDFTFGEWGEEQAVKYVTALLDALDEINATPDRWRLRDDIYPGCRARVCGSHLIIYRLHEGTVEFSRILHGAMNFSDHIPRDFMGSGETTS